MELLRGHVGELALQRAGGRLVCASRGAGHPEVHDPHRAIEPQEEVLRSHIAMHDVSERAVVITELVRGVQPFARLLCDVRQHRRATRAIHEDRVRARERARHASEGLTRQVLHRQEVGAVRFAEVEHAADVRVVDPRGDARFVEEHVDELLLLREMRMDELHRHQLLETRESGRARQVHGRHAPAGQLVAEDVATESPALCELGRRSFELIRVGH